jgi:hypothetical protein
MSSNKKSKLMKEQEEIRRLRSLSTVLNIGDIENAVLSNTSKESEPISDDIIDELLNNAASATANPQEQKNLDTLERLTTGGSISAERGIARRTSRHQNAARSRPKAVKKKAPMHKQKATESKGKRSKKR